DGGTRDLGVRAAVPGRRQRVDRGLRLPPTLGHDSDGALADLHDVLDTRHALHFGRIETYELAAEHRGILDRRAQHARQLEVDAVDLLAGHFGRGVEPFERLAGDLPVLRILERDLLRRLDLRSRFGDLPEGRRAAGQPMRDHAVRSNALRG